MFYFKPEQILKPGAGINNRIFIAATIVISAQFCACAGVISGIVSSAQTGRPIAKASVTLEPGQIVELTREDGGFTFDSAVSGTYYLVCKANGFETQKSGDVYVAGSEKKPIDFEMNPSVYRLKKMVVRSSVFRRPPDMAASSKTMSFDEILRQPGALVDIQRAVQNLPSVASGGDNVNEVVVRGGMPGENSLVMDNVEIPNPNHFAGQGTGGGVVSLINPLLVRGLTFCAGAPPAQYGGKASSVIDVKLRDGNSEMILAGVDLGMAGVGGHIEGPLWPNRKHNSESGSADYGVSSGAVSPATFMVSGHRSYLDFLSSFQNTVAVPRFWGVQGKVSWRQGINTVYVNGIFGRNAIIIENARADLGMDEDVIESGGQIYAAGLNWDAAWSERLSTTFTVSGTGNTFDRLTYNPSAESGVAGDTGFFNASSEQEQTVKAAVSFNVSENTMVSAGAYARRCDFDIDFTDMPDTLVRHSFDSSALQWLPDSAAVDENGFPVVLSQDVNRHAKGWKYGGYVSGIVPVFNALKVTPGVRFDAFDYTGSFSVSPRLGAVLSVAPVLDFTGSFGIQYQDPDYTDLVKNSANSDLSAKQAITGTCGIEVLIEKFDAKAVVEGYYKRYYGTPLDSSLIYADTSVYGRFRNSDRMYAAGEGKSYGAEFFIHRKMTGNFFCTAAYSFSRSFNLDLRPSHEGEWYSGDYDFRHALTLTGGIKSELKGKAWYDNIHSRLWFKLLSPLLPIADRMEFSAKWRYLGGRPYTAMRYDDEFQLWYEDRSGKLNSMRYDPYHRLDLRWERRYGFGLVHMIYYFDFQNVYGRNNVWQYVYPAGSKQPRPVYQFPFFPAGGVIVGF